MAYCGYVTTLKNVRPHSNADRMKLADYNYKWDRIKEKVPAEILWVKVCNLLPLNFIYNRIK